MQLFYLPTVSTKSNTIFFDKEERKHILKVLRKRVDDILVVTNGRGDKFTTKLILTTPKQCVAKIITRVNIPKRQFYLHIAMAPTKQIDRFEWFIEKATEIGIEEITPLICDHSERKIVKFERLQKIIQSAMKQSLQFYLPKLNPCQTFGTFVSKKISETKYIAHCQDASLKNLKNLLEPKEKTTILIGPEGDFSLKEIKLALEHHWIPVTLGDTRLRTETAGLVACHTTAMINK